MQVIAAHQILKILLETNLNILIPDISDIYSRVIYTLHPSIKQIWKLKQWIINPLVKGMIDSNERHKNTTQQWA